MSSRTAEIFQDLHDQRVEREVLDASGFPLAAIGSLIAGVPGAFLVVTVVTSAGTVESPTWIWWACLVLGVGSIVWVVYRLVRNQSAISPQDVSRHPVSTSDIKHSKHS